MARRKVRLAFIIRDAERKASYKKRKKGLFKKVLELSTLCDVEVAAIIYSAFHREAEVWPSHEEVIRIIERFRALPEIEQSKRQVNLEGFTRQRIKKLEDQLRKIRKENRIKEFTNLMYDLLGGQEVPQNMHPYDLNDLTFVIDQNLQKVYERMTEEAKKHGFTFNIPLTGPIVPPRGTTIEEPRAPLAPPQVVPPVAPTSMVRPMASITMVRPMAPSMVRPFAASSYAPPLPVPPRFVPPLGLSRALSPVPPPRMFRPVGLSSWAPAPVSRPLFRPMVAQMVSPMPPVVDTRSWATRVASSPMPPTVAPRVAFPMPPAAAPRSWAPSVASPMPPAAAPRSWAPSVASPMPLAAAPNVASPMPPAAAAPRSWAPSVASPMPPAAAAPRSWAPSVASPTPPAAAPRSWAPGVASSMPPAVAPGSWAPTVASSMPLQMAPAMSPRMDFPMIPVLSQRMSSPMVPSVTTSPMANSMNSSVDASMPMNNYQNYFYGNPQGPPDWEEDALMAFVNGGSNIFEEPNHHNNNL